MNRIVFFVCAHGLLAVPVLAQVVINEVCFDSSTVADETGNTRSDWIELYNRGASGVNLSGYALGDTNPYDEAHGVRLPDYTIPAGGYLVVFADADAPEYVAWVNTASGPKPVVHGQFRLSREGEKVHLFNTYLTRVHMFTPPGFEIGRNRSYGALPDGSTTSLQVFDTPTPGAPNGSGTEGPAGPVDEKGAYDGYFFSESAFNAKGTVSAVRGTLALKVVRAAGALTAKAVIRQRTLSFRASAWDAQEEDGIQRVTLTARSGEKLGLNVRPTRVWGTLTGGALGGESLTLDGVRNRFADSGDAEAQARLEGFKGYYTAALPVAGALSSSEAVRAAPQGAGYLAVTVGNNGAVKIAGVLADGTKVALSSRLLLMEDEGEAACVPLFAPLYLRKGWVGGLLRLTPRGGPMVTDHERGEPVRWEKPGLGPDGFSELLAVCGGYYATVPSLASHYLFGADVGPVPYHFAGGAAEWVSGALPRGVGVSVAGTRLSLARGAMPVLADGAYVYADENSSQATLACTARTGLFKGNFNLYYDYEAGGRLRHTTVRVPYAGVLTPVRGPAFAGLPAGMGYCLVRDNDPALRAYRLKRSFPVWLAAE